MTTDVVEEVRKLAPVVETTSEFGRARQRRKLTDAIAAESTSLRQEQQLEAIGFVASPRTGRGRRRRIYLAGAAAAAVAAIGVAIPVSIGSNTPAVTQGTKSGGPVMELASYHLSFRLRLPSTYRLTSATATQCADVVRFPTQSPAYASEMTAAANAQGGCIAMVLTPTYTSTSANPDPLGSRLLENAQPAKVGPYQGEEGTSIVPMPSDVTGQEVGVLVEVPVTGGQTQDLIVSTNNLSANALVSLVANGLSVAGSSGATSPTSNTSGTTGSSGTAGNTGSASTSSQNG